MNLVRSKTDRKLAGVLGGLAQRFGIHSNFLRFLFLLFMITTGFFPMLIIYLALVFILPNKGDSR